LERVAKKDTQDVREWFTSPRLYGSILVVILLLSAVLRYGLLDVPLERDEGEYAYAGQLILNGFLPYQDLYAMKLPGIYAVYAGILSVFGQTQTGVHLALLLINSSTILMLFLLGRRLFGPVTGLMAAACFSVLSVSQSVQGVFANAEHFVILPAVSGMVLLLKAVDENRSGLVFWSGLLFGIGFIIKQHGMFFIAFGAVYLLIAEMKMRPFIWRHFLLRFCLLVLGAALPYAITCLLFIFAGIFHKFWFWTVKYAFEYSSEMPLENAWGAFKINAADIVRSAPFIWIIAGIGLTSIVWDRYARERWIFVVCLLVFSLLAICPGFYFRPHYFLLTLPAVGLLAGMGIMGLHHALLNGHVKALKFIVPVLAVVICAGSIWQEREFLFKMSPAQASRSTYGLNPFPESIELGRFIRENTQENDRIAVFGSEPQLFFYSGRRSATGHIYMYPLMEGHEFALEMQSEMIREIKENRPEILIFVKVPTSWLVRADSHRRVFEWFQGYQAANYSLAGVAELSGLEGVYRWGPDVNWPPRTDLWVALFKRKEQPEAGKDRF